MKQKIKISNLEVKSFVTSISLNEKVIGGQQTMPQQCTLLTCGIVACTRTLAINCRSYDPICYPEP